MRSQMLVWERWVILVVACILSLNLVLGLPIPGPDLSVCQPTVARSGKVLDCCLPTDVPVKEFQFPDPSEPMKVRKNSAGLDTETKEKLNLAYQRMRALPPHDPRSMAVQSNLHCGYCCQVYKVQNSTKVLEIHRNWLLLPFHRWYVYFHERILASLIDDQTLGIPYWNWDNQSTTHQPVPNVLPEWVLNTSSSLYDAKRDPRHMPPVIADLHWGPLGEGGAVPVNATVEELRLINDVMMHQTIVSASTLPHLFMGGLYRFEDDAPYTPSLFELGPHASIHRWVGDGPAPFGEDMAPAYSAARDPLFYQHHGNVDRLWRDWKALGGRRNYPDSSDWLDAAFLFYDEKGEMVRVTVRQSLDIEKLKYSFEPTENAWLEDPSTPLSTPESSTPGLGYLAGKIVGSFFSQLGWNPSFLTKSLVGIPDVESVRAPTFLGSAFRARVARPHAALKAAGKLDHLEEVLVIDRIWIPSRKPIWFDIFINLPEADESTPLYATEWCGRFNNGPHLDRAGTMERESVFSISIGEKLKKLGIVHQPSLVVSLVPRGADKHEREIQIRTIRVELQ